MQIVKEQILVDSLKRGDGDAQRTLYEMYAGRLLSIARRYVGQLEPSQDVLHDSFIKILRSIGGFNYRGEGSLRGWMERITINTALEHLRSKSKLQLLDERYMTDVEDAAPSLGEVESIEHEQLLRLVGELPDGYRTVFNLFCVEGYSHREIAQMLGINEKSSSSQLLRAKRLLASKIRLYVDSL